MPDASGAPSKTPTAPYTAFQTIKTTAKYMKEHGVPDRLDRSVFPTFSGAVIGQLITALKFLDAIDADGRPKPALKALVHAYETDAWATTLAEVIKKAYVRLFDLNLETASPQQFTERFRKEYPAAEDVSRKSITFFLNAAREGQIKVSPYIMRNKKPRSGPTKRRAPKANGTAATQNSNGATQQTSPSATVETAAKKSSEIILGLLDMKEMTKEEQDAVWTLLRFFSRKGQ